MAAKTTAENLAAESGPATPGAMAGAVALRSLTLRNVLSFGAEAKVELGPLNVLIGPNGCGKSNLMDVVALLKAAATGDLSGEFRSKGMEWPWKGGGEKLPNMGVESEWRGTTTGKSRHHEMAVQVDDSGSYSIVNEMFGHPDSSFAIARAEGADGRISILRPECPAKVAKEADSAEFPDGIESDVGRRAVSAMLADVCVYRSRHVGRTGRGQNPLRVAGPADESKDKVSESLGNFPNVLNRIYEDPECKKAVDEKMGELNEDARGLYFRVAHGAVEVVLQEKGGRAIPASRMSDGMLNWLFLLTVLLDPKPPALVCIDEPEAGLHPDMFPALAKMLVDASSRMQIIVTTHAGGLVDALTDHPEAIVVCGKSEDGITTMRRLSAKDLRGREDEGLGMAWASGAIGGTRW